MNLLCRYASRVLLSCNLLYHAVHVDSLSAGGTSPPMATECVDYDLALLFEFPCQVRRYQPPFENLLLGIDERIGILLVDLACTDEFPDHLVLPIKHMQIHDAFCPCLSVHIFKFYIRQGAGALICISVRGQYISYPIYQPREKGQTLSSGIEYKPLENVCPLSIHLLPAYPNSVCLFTVGIAL